MNIGENLGLIEDNFKILEEYLTAPDPDELPRTPDIIAMERQLHHGPTAKLNRRHPQGLDRWSRVHAHDQKAIGTLGYWPNLFKGQQINRASTPFNTFAVLLPENIHLRVMHRLFELTVGSKEVSEDIIDGFNNTPAFSTNDEHELSWEVRYPDFHAYCETNDLPGNLTDYAVFCLENKISFGVSSAHLERLADVGEFTAGLSLAVAARKGRTYLENFKLMVNKNMTRETYKKIPISWLLSWGLTPYWGLPPGKGPEDNAISDEIMEQVNIEVVRQFVRDQTLGSVALGFVPAGSRPGEATDPETGKTILKLKQSFTDSFAYRCKGGVIIANRVGDKVEIGHVIEQSDQFERRVSRNEFVDKINRAHALQAVKLTGQPAAHTAISPANKDELIVVREA